jgi:hypothetical protein
MSQACHERTVQAAQSVKHMNPKSLAAAALRVRFQAELRPPDRSTENGTLLEMCYPAMGSKP